MSEQVNVKERSSSGLDPNIAGALCYILGFVSGVVFLVTERKSRFVRFHALQSIVVFVALLLFQLILGSRAAILTSWVVFVTISLWVFLMYKAYLGEPYRLPLAGAIAARELNRPL